jgi:hypothetical protein
LFFRAYISSIRAYPSLIAGKPKEKESKRLLLFTV